MLPEKLSVLLAVPEAPGWAMFLIGLVVVVLVARRAFDRRSLPGLPNAWRKP